MSLTESTMQFKLGGKAPEFSLLDTVSNQLISLHTETTPTATVIMFICNHCPYVQHINQGLVKLANDYQHKGIRFIAISSNDVVNFPEDAPDKMAEAAVQLGYPFPYLYDESQHIAKAYLAACTPDFYILDKQLSCVYRGQFDNSRPGNELPVTGNDIRQALDNLLSGKPVSRDQKPSIGCNIKWK